MENRDRDKLSRNSGSTSAGDVNRETSSRIGNRQDESTSEFGQKIGRSENLNEPNSRQGAGNEGMRSDRGRSGSVDHESESGVSDRGMDRDRSGSSRGRH